jgi:hypothetical protein
MEDGGNRRVFAGSLIYLFKGNKNWQFQAMVHCMEPMRRIQGA